jgi:hypothetical protein
VALVWDPSEAEWQAEVIKLANLGRWLSYHTYNSKRSAAGFPDLTLVRGPELVFAELKTERGKVKPEQQGWLDALAATGADVYVWRPSDLDEVSQRLVGRSR